MHSTLYNRLLYLLMMVLGVTLFVILITYTPIDGSLNSTAMFYKISLLDNLRNIVADLFFQLFGLTSYLLPIFLISCSFEIYIKKRILFLRYKIISFFYAFITTPPLVAVTINEYEAGILGLFLAKNILLFSEFSYVFILLSLIAILFSLSITLSDILYLKDLSIYFTKNTYKKIYPLFIKEQENKDKEAASFFNGKINFLPDLESLKISKKLKFLTPSLKKENNNLDIFYDKNKAPEKEEMNEADLENSIIYQNIKSSVRGKLEEVKNESVLPNNDENQKIKPSNTIDSDKNEDESQQEKINNIPLEESKVPQFIKPEKEKITEKYHIPMDFLQIKSQKETISTAEIKQNAFSLEQIIQEFGINCKVVNIKTGPVVTLYEIAIPAGVKTSKIIALETDIALRMKAVSVRIAIVPGKDVVGIEIPNSKRKTVFLREILQNKSFKESEAKLPIALGYDINGNAIVGDLAAMPHLLIAGTTGSGKSVGVNGMILSLLYKLSPEECKLIMIDPKMLELSVYQDIPHLLTPVVINPKQAISALKWVVKEMENRYYQMSLIGVRNISGFNEKVQQVQTLEKIKNDLYNNQGLEINFLHLPYIVVVIDEMADLMMVAGKEVEQAVQRLAQMARAAGIHLIMATQRPSVDVITGTIKANFPTRISFQVSSKIDSRTILGEQGAEQLLGKGDMLYMSGVGRIQRVHGAFTSDDEVSKVVDFLKELSNPDYIDNITSVSITAYDSGGSDEKDDLYSEVIEMIQSEGKVSTSFIQRKFQIGYNRAARIVEQLEEDSIISKANSVGKREILIK